MYASFWILVCAPWVATAFGFGVAFAFKWLVAFFRAQAVRTERQISEALASAGDAIEDYELTGARIYGMQIASDRMQAAQLRVKANRLWRLCNLCNLLTFGS